MKISIFESVNPLPKSKEEKHEQSKRATQCRVVVANDDNDLVSLVTAHAWSPFVFANNKRLASNFLSCDLLVYDIDDSLTIDEAEVIVAREKLCCLCLPSTSHTPENQRFRIILPLARTITNAEVYAETWRKGADLFGVVDEQTKDMGRFYFGCRSDDGFWLEGSFFIPCIPVETARPSDYSSGVMVTVTEDLEALTTQIYGEKRDKISESVEFFLKNAKTRLPGKWINSINSAAFSLSLSGVDEEIIMQVFEQLAPEGKLDKRDIYQIKRAVRDGVNARD